MKKFLITLLIILIFPVMAFAKSKSTINVAFTIDNNYPIFALLAINSILLNNYSGSDYHFYIVENNLTEKNKQKMQKYLSKMTEDKNFTVQMEFIDIDTSRADKGKKFTGYVDVITPIAMARIFLPELLKEDRVLYLDGDILVTTDLSELYNTDLGNNVVAMGLNIGDQDYPGLYRFKNGYYNSGVILMDLNKCRKMKMTDKMLTYLDKNFDKFVYEQSDCVNFLYPDQDLINIVLDGKIKRLDTKWNNQVYKDSVMVKSETLGGCIFHFISRVKPWMFEKPFSGAVKLYIIYWENSLLHWYKYYYLSYYYCVRYHNICISEIKRKFDRYALLFGCLFNLDRDINIWSLFTYQCEN